MRNKANTERMEKWRFQSSEEPGFHAVVTPETAECIAVQVYRLNLPAGQSYKLESGELEMHPVLISGKAKLSGHATLDIELDAMDSFYIPGNDSIEIAAVEDCIFYVAAAKYEGIGEPCYRKYDPTLPIGDIHQIHGSGSGQREVMFTLDPKTPASRLICGFTWSGDGTWTGWAPHQHELDLEEVYCYFDMPQPRFGFHVSYLKSGEIDDIVAHPVYSGTMVEAPCGYHPTVASPGGRNSYLWVLASFKTDRRRYDLAISDPNYV